MTLLVYNVLNRKKEVFQPIADKVVKMYACGITVSGDAHIGHARQAIVYDVIRRYLEHIGYQVIYIRNYTDVDDKIIAKASELAMDPMEYARLQIVKTDKVLLDLGVRPATIEPKASENIEEMITFIEGLIEKGHAYATSSGDVYFAIDTFDGYGKLSNQRPDENLTGVRKNATEGKRSDLDFALWKSAKLGEVSWTSPWGEGRPGWHIECSVMSTKYLGNTIDIHGGGKDLVFPHHENEIAQSEAYTGVKFANYWIHNGLINVNGQKMSKSLNNGITVQSLLDKYNYEVIRMALLQFGYRADLNIVDGMFEDVEQHLYNFYQTFKAINLLDKFDEPSLLNQTIKDNFEENMNDDFNTGNAISDLYSYFTELNKLVTAGSGSSKSIKEQLVKTYQMLGILQAEPIMFISEINKKYLKLNNLTEAEILSLIQKRNEAKMSKDYELADQIRKNLEDKHIVLLDKRDNVEWQVKIK